MKKLIFCIAILAVSSNAIAWDRGYKEYYNRSNQYQGYSTTPFADDDEEDEDSW